MKRSGIRRKAPITRAPLTTGRRRKARKPSETQRVYGPVERRRFVTSLPCVYCVAISPVFALVGGKCHQAHTVTGGVGRKANADTIVPLCPGHHRRYDEHRHPFDDKQTRDWVKSQAPLVEAAWQAHRDNPEHVSTIIARVVAELVK